MSDQNTITAEAPRSGPEGLPPLPAPALTVLNPWLVGFASLALVAAGAAAGWRLGSDRQFEAGYKVGVADGRGAGVADGFARGKAAGYRACLSEQDDDHKPKGARP